MTAVEEDALRLMEQVQGSFWERQDSAPLRSVMAAEGRSWPLPPCPDPAVALADEQYDTTPLSEDACLVRGTFRTVSLDAAMADTPRRLTAVQGLACQKGSRTHEKHQYGCPGCHQREAFQRPF